MTTNVPWSKVAILGMVIPPLIGNPCNGYINPYYWVDDFIPYYMEIMGVDRPDRTNVSTMFLLNSRYLSVKTLDSIFGTSGLPSIGASLVH